MFPVAVVFSSALAPARLLTAGTWASSLIARSLRFPRCEIGAMAVSDSQTCHDAQMTKCWTGAGPGVRPGAGLRRRLAGPVASLSRPLAAARGPVLTRLLRKARPRPHGQPRSRLLACFPRARLPRVSSVSFLRASGLGPRPGRVSPEQAGVWSVQGRLLGASSGAGPRALLCEQVPEQSSVFKEERTRGVQLRLSVRGEKREVKQSGKLPAPDTRLGGF